jgi:hypothetical protein
MENKMKKWMLVSMVISLVLVLTACGSAQSSTAIASDSTVLSLEGQLLVGTLKLENTDLAVTYEQAQELLPLWETLQSLASSGTAASQEVDAVVSQIENVMSAQQISSITIMNLTQQDLVIATTNTGASSTASSSANKSDANAVQFQEGAGVPGTGDSGGGNPPADTGGGMPASVGIQPVDQLISNQSIGTVDQISSTLINVLVELLLKRIG